MLFRWLSRLLAAYLSRKVVTHSVSTATFEALSAALQPADVLLVEGDARISVAIRYLTQSTWSHAALYLGPDAGLPVASDGEPHVLVEADLEAGIRTLPLSFYRHMHTRVCRPVGLDEQDVRTLTTHARNRVGDTYDLRNVVDLARYLCPTPPVPTRYRRQMLALGSGDPTRAICSTFIAQSFQHIRYPILPQRIHVPSDNPNCEGCRDAYYRIRHHSLFVPRDFDASPYFDIIKSSIQAGFDHRTMPWIDETE
ncbi:lipo-like protein [Salicola sp. Rm-C-2C1-2]|uniref:lipo-like protein n=1 Tax=Salicola sp. Rm-C-2C1-2 TaxID=3141321 RepID=UPI0032E52B3C